ncbi:hypothetical protein EW026_g6920 [Hermanssonia centrifuga]|uniref:TPR-like protein n=1 Tax=Hermanssonia centrifuga TaxID=98765 RepID=A0A4S4KDW0_9APHY|nr:hypothetical protein EW026_g6920 [Hermanssonia centrifuga]
MLDEPSDASYNPSRAIELIKSAASLTASEANDTTHEVNQAFAYYREALHLLPPDHRLRPYVLETFALRLMSRFQELGGIEDIDDCIKYQREVLTLPPSRQEGPIEDDQESVDAAASSLYLFGDALILRFERTEDLRDVEEAIESYGNALVLTPDDDPMHCRLLKKLMEALLLRFRELGRKDDIDEAVRRQREIISLSQTEDSDSATGAPAIPLNRMGDILLYRFASFNSINDLIEGIESYRNALSLLPNDSPLRRMFLNDLAKALTLRFEKQGDRKDINEAISCQREAAILPDTDDDDVPSALVSSLSLLGYTTMRGFQRSGRFEELDEATKSYSQAIAHCPDDGPRRLALLKEVTKCLVLRFNARGRAEDLEEAITHQRELVTLSALLEDEESFAWSLYLLGNIYMLRFNKLSAITDLAEAVESYEQALALIPEDSSKRHKVLDNLAGSLMSRYKEKEKIEDLNGAIQRQREAIACPSIETAQAPIRPLAFSLHMLGEFLSLRYERLSKLEDLDEAINNFGQAVVLSDKGDIGRIMFLQNYANSLKERFDLTGQVADNELAIKSYRELVAPHSPRSFGFIRVPDITPEIRASHLFFFAECLESHFLQSGRVQDLDDAISSLRESVALVPQKAAHIGFLGGLLARRYQSTGQSKDLDDAIECQYKALTLDPGDRSLALTNLAVNFNHRYAVTGKASDLDKAIDLSREAIALCHIGHPAYIAALSNLALFLSSRFDRSGRAEDFEETVDIRRQVTTLNAGAADHYEDIANLASSLLRQFQQTGEPKYLDEGVMHLRKALSEVGPGAKRADLLNNLGTTTYSRFHQSGALQDVEEATACFREVTELRPPGHISRPADLTNLATVLYARFRLIRRIDDLRGAIQVAREALSTAPKGHVHRAIYLNNLGSYLDERFQRLDSMNDLEEAITCYRESLSSSDFGHRTQLAVSSNLAVALSTRYEKLNQAEDLEEAVDLHRSALILAPPEHPDKALMLSHLAGVLTERFSRTHQIQDQEEALELLHRAVAILLPSHPSLTGTLQALALAYWNGGDHEQAFSLFEDAVNQPTSNPRDRFTSARFWAVTARGAHHPSALSAYMKALELLTLCLTSTPTVDLQHEFQVEIASVSSLAPNGASCAIERGELEKAVEILEQGRALLWSRMRGYRHPLEKLREADPRLADEFETLSSKLQHLAVSSGRSKTIQVGATASTLEHDFDARMAQNRKLSEAFEMTIASIRQLDGFSSFLQAAPFHALQTAAKEGPIILVNIDKWRSDVLILLATSAPLLLPLAEGLPEVVRRLSLELVEVDRTARDAERYGVRHRSKRIDMGSILRTLWEKICQPVAVALQKVGCPVGSRIWWCPIGRLSSLPLHAAGIYENGVLVEGFPDLYMSSYTPTLTSLIASRETAVKESSHVRLLGVGQSNSLPEVSSNPTSITSKCVLHL